MPSDRLAELFERYRSRGDLGALSRVFDALAPELLAIARHLAPSEADDLVQATFLTAIERAASFDAARRLEPWLAGILIRHAKRARRQRIDREDAAELELESAEPDPSRAAEEGELGTAVATALRHLPPRYGEMLGLYLLGEQAPSEIARQSGRPPGTVRSRLHRGLRRLRLSLPTGLGAGALLLSFGRGPLAPVRARVLEAGERATAARGGDAGELSAAPGLARTIASPALAVAIGAAALLLARNVVAPAGPELAPAARASESDLRQGESAPADVASSARAALGPGSTAELAAEIDPYGSLDVELVWASDGSPAADVGFRAIAWDEPRFLSRIAEAATDAAGRVLVPRIHAGTVELYLDRAGITRLAVKAGERTRARIEVPRGADVRGRIVDEGGRPLAGAEVWLSWVADIREFRRAATADEAGGFVLRSVEATRFVYARAAGFAPSDVHWLGSPRAPEADVIALELALARDGSSLEGLVLDPRDEPLAGARVIVRSERDPRPRVAANGELVLSTPPCELETDARGRFACDGIAAGDALISVAAEGLPVANRRIALEPGSSARVVIELERGATVSGRMLRPDGSVPRFAAVRIVPSALFPEGVVSVDAEGRYVLEDVPPGEVELCASQVHVGDLAPVRTRLWVGPGEHARWDATLPDGIELRGRALGERGMPLEGWWVRAEREPSERAGGASLVGRWLAQSYAESWTWAFAQRRTDADGRFRLAHCEDAPYRLELRPPGSARGLAVATFADARPGGAELELRVDSTVSRGAEVRGNVRDESDRPLGGARVVILRESSPGAAESRCNAEDGSFAILGLAPGRYSLVIWPPGRPLEAARELEVAAGEVLELGALHLASPGELRVRVRVRAPTSGESVRLELEGPAGDSSELRADAEGRARFGPLVPGRYALAARAPRCAPARVEVDVRAGELAEVEVALAFGSPVRVEVRGAGALEGGVLLRLRRSAENEEPPVLSIPLAAELAGECAEHALWLAPGQYEAEALAATGSRARAQFDVSAAEPDELLVCLWLD